MKALTVWQPYASAIVAGAKSCENRSWYPPECEMGNWIGIHAGLVFEAKAHRDIAGAYLWPDMPGIGEFPLGELLGAARLSGILPEPNPIDSWQIGPRVWLFDRAVQLAEPVPMRGRQRLWNLPKTAARALADLL